MKKFMGKKSFYRNPLKEYMLEQLKVEEQIWGSVKPYLWGIIYDLRLKFKAKNVLVKNKSLKALSTHFFFFLQG